MRFLYLHPWHIYYSAAKSETGRRKENTVGQILYGAYFEECLQPTRLEPLMWAHVSVAFANLGSLGGVGGDAAIQQVGEWRSLGTLFGRRDDAHQEEGTDLAECWYGRPEWHQVTRKKSHWSSLRVCISMCVENLSNSQWRHSRPL